MDLALGVSSYNRDVGCARIQHTGVLPSSSCRSVCAAARRFHDRNTAPGRSGQYLFVGRIAPKRRSRIIRLAEHYKRCRHLLPVHFVGQIRCGPRALTVAHIVKYQMLSDRFWFTGPVPDLELAAYYRNAHAYVSLSEHEGFCVPLVEAMAMDVPVLAYAGGAVPETLGGAVVSFAPKDLEQAAELLGGLSYDDPFRSAVLTGKRRRVLDFGRDRLASRLQAVLEAVA